MLVWAEEFLDLLYSRRLVWISGTLGRGKTALAYRLALEMVARRKVKWVVSNVTDAISDDLSKVQRENGKLSACVILDEAGKWIRTRDISDKYRADLRKLDLIMLMPSNMEPTLNLRKFRVFTWVDLGYIGIPIKILKWRYKEDDSEIQGYFLWIDYREIYGVFKTSEVVDEDKGIASWISKEAGRTDNAGFEGSNNGHIKDEQGTGMVEALQAQASNLEDIYDIIEAGGAVLSGKGSKKRR